MIFVDVPWFVAVAFWIGFTVCWRTLTGHVAWTVHRTAREQKTIRPPTENWLVAAVPCALLSLMWPAVLLFALRWPWARGAEREAEVKLRGIEFAQLEARSDRYGELAERSWDERFEHIKGEVE